MSVCYYISSAMDVTLEILPLHRCLENSPCEKLPQALIDLDLSVMKALIPLRDPLFMKWIQWVTNGLPGFALMIVAVLLFWRSSSGRSMDLKSLLGKYPILLYAALCLGLSDGSATLLKKYFGRIKPLVDLATEHVRFSFPSNHSVNCATLAMMSYILLRPTMRHPRRYWIAISSFALFVAGTRVFLWEHFPSDVLAGLILGAVFGLIAGLVGRRILSLRSGHRIDVEKPAPETH